MNNNLDIELLKKIYIKMLIAAVFLLAIVYSGQLLNLLSKKQMDSVRTISIILFTLSVIFSIAAPIFLRAAFVNKVKDYKQVPFNEFITFEKQLLIVVLLAPFIVVLAVFFNAPSLYLSGILLFALYAVYYYYPSEKRIKFERKIFRVKIDS